MPRPKNEKYKIGDAVRIRKDFDRRKRYDNMGISETMENKKGTIVYILRSRSGGAYFNGSPIYSVATDKGDRDDDGWDWTDDMFVEVNRK